MACIQPCHMPGMVLVQVDCQSGNQIDWRARCRRVQCSALRCWRVGAGPRLVRLKAGMGLGLHKQSRDGTEQDWIGLELPPELALRHDVHTCRAGVG